MKRPTIAPLGSKGGRFLPSETSSRSVTSSSVMARRRARREDRSAGPRSSASDRTSRVISPLRQFALRGLRYVSDMQRQRPLFAFTLFFVPLLLGCARAAVAKPPAPPKDDPALGSRVRAELLHACDGYKRYAWGHDELNPISKTPHDWYGGT